MFEVTLLAYMSSGATLGRASFDFFYQVMACIIILKILWLQGVRTSEVEDAEEYGQIEELAIA